MASLVSRLRIVPIVEGHGEQRAVRILLDRIWRELIHGDYIDVLTPIRQRKAALTGKPPALSRALDLAMGKLANPDLKPTPAIILILVDADKDLPCRLGPELLQLARSTRSDADIACVIANIEYESWFVAAAESLKDYLEFQPNDVLPVNPEQNRLGKAWISRRFRGVKYSETVDQPKLTARMDLVEARAHSASFDRLCRELERRFQS